MLQYTHDIVLLNSEPEALYTAIKKHLKELRIYFSIKDGLVANYRAIELTVITTDNIFKSFLSTLDTSIIVPSYSKTIYCSKPMPIQELIDIL